MNGGDAVEVERAESQMQTTRPWLTHEERKDISVGLLNDDAVELGVDESQTPSQRRPSADDNNTSDNGSNERKLFLDFTSSQIVTVLACFVSWGMDIFDSVLFNFVAPSAIPELLGLELDSPAAIAATIEWSGLLMSLMLLFWSFGGIGFGYVADRFGRTRTMQITIAMFAVGTGLCAASTSIWFLIVCRIIAAIGIGGEWASGASLVAESVPDKRRVEAGAFLFVASPLGMFLAGLVARVVTGALASSSSSSVAWRVVMLTGVAPAIVAFALRCCVREPERWIRATTITTTRYDGELDDAIASGGEVVVNNTTNRFSALFDRSNRVVTITNLVLSIVILLLLWPMTAFIPTLATGFAIRASTIENRTAMIESYKSLINNCFTFGGVGGTIVAAAIAKCVGRRPMFLVYFVGVLASNALVFANPNGVFSDETIMYLFAVLGFFVYGIAGTMTFYLPESFPTAIRATGSALCLNAGRIIAAAGPFVVGYVASQGSNAVNLAINALFWNGWIAVVPLLSVKFMVETRDVELK